MALTTLTQEAQDVENSERIKVGKALLVYERQMENAKTTLANVKLNVDALIVRLETEVDFTTTDVAEVKAAINTKIDEVKAFINEFEPV